MRVMVHVHGALQRWTSCNTNAEEFVLEAQLYMFPPAATPSFLRPVGARHITPTCHGDHPNLSKSFRFPAEARGPCCSGSLVGEGVGASPLRILEHDDLGRMPQMIALLGRGGYQVVGPRTARLVLCDGNDGSNGLASARV